MLAAEMLIKHSHYSSTVNRAYYSCLQYILHILFEKLGYTHADLSKTPRDGTHSQAQYLLEMSLVRKVGSNKSDYKWFQEKFPEFKQDRVIADYYSDALNQEKGYNAINTATSIMNTLKKYY
ncbi:MAG: hypothetical protein WKG06_31265 [Segetibacter sp.]